jgi:hypothetical protein
MQAQLPVRVRYRTEAFLLFHSQHHRAILPPAPLLRPSKQSVSCAFFVWMRQRNKWTISALYPGSMEGKSRHLIGGVAYVVSVFGFRSVCAATVQH